MGHTPSMMQAPKSYAIRIDNHSDSKALIHYLINQRPIEGLNGLEHKRGLLFSRSEIDRYMEEEQLHDVKVLTKGRPQTLNTMSSGEQKKALLAHLLGQKPDFLILVNPFDNLDVETQSHLREELKNIGSTRILVQLVGRVEDILPETTDFYFLKGDQLLQYHTAEAFWETTGMSQTFEGNIPFPIHREEMTWDELVNFNGVSVSFDGRQVLDQVHWTVKPGEFWQLIGPNGSGKTTLLSMITGDSHKGYGQDLTLFGQKKGSGESVWDLKEKIGYFTPAVTDRFKGYHSLENMVISGLHDSIGLYVIPSDTERQLAHSWLGLLGLHDKREQYFRDLSTGEKRLVMIARAMVKHPPLLILDEPTAGLDDPSARLLVTLVNKMAQESNTAILFVSHRKEPGLRAELHYILDLGDNESQGRALKNR